MHDVAPQLVRRSRSTLPHFLPHVCTSIVNRACDFYWERRLGVCTTGAGLPATHPDAHQYGYLAYHTYFSLLNELHLGADDVVADLGCGKGRVLFAAARYPVREVVGVEISPTLHAIAEANVAKLRGRHAPVRCVCASATQFDYDDVTAIVMFHPFGPNTMREVLRRIEQSLARRPRRLRIAYGNPIEGAILAAEPWLKLEQAWHPGRWSRIKFPVNFYVSQAPRVTRNSRPSMEAPPQQHAAAALSAN
jgi:SAM-dependent methyltransferase